MSIAGDQADGLAVFPLPETGSRRIFLGEPFIADRGLRDKGAHTDALGLMGQLLDAMMPPGKLKPEERVVEDSWDVAFRRQNEAANDIGGWKVA